MNRTTTLGKYSALLAGALLALPASADMKDLLEMSEKLDKIEKQDFGEAIDKANACTQARDFSCTSSWLAKASKLANGSRDKQMLAAAQQNMANEKARIAEEERQRAEEQRRIAEAEERLRVAEAEAARRASESREPSTTMQLLQFGTAMLGQMAAEKARLAAAAANSTRSSSGGLPLADLSSERRAIEKARADAAAAQRAREQANAARAAANTSRVVAAPQPTQTSDRREQTIASRMAAANAPSVYPTPQPTIEPSRESCPPGYKPSTNPRTVPASAFCVSDPQYAGGTGGQGSSGSDPRSGSASTRTASSSSSGSAGSSNTGGSDNGAGSPSGGNTNAGGYPNSGGNSYPSGGSSPTAGGPSTPRGTSTPGGSSDTRVATTGGGYPNTGGSYPNLDRPSGGSQPKKLYPLIRHFTFPTLGFTEREGCAEAEKKVEEQYSRSYNQSRMVSRDGCSCTKEKDIYGTIYLCKIPVTDELMVDYDPNAPTSNTSR